MVATFVLYGGIVFSLICMASVLQFSLWAPAKAHPLFLYCLCQETNLSNTFLESSESARTNERSCYILRAINATIHLQALTLKNQHCSVKNVSKLGSERAAIGELVIGGTKKGSDVDKGGFHGDVVAKEVEEFCEHDFYTTLRNECVLPDCHTYEVRVPIISNQL